MRGSVGSTVATAFPVALQRTVGTTERRRAQAQQTFQQERVPDAQRERPGKRADVHTQQPVRRHERQPCHSATDSAIGLHRLGSVSLRARRRSVELCRLRSDCTAAWGDVML